MKPFFYSFKNNTKILLGQMSSFKFLFFGWLFASQKTGFSGFRYRFIPSLRFGTDYASPYNPCHCLKLKNSKLNLLNFILVLNFCFIFYKNCFCCNFNFFIVTNKHFFNIFFFHFWRNETYNWNDYQSTNHCKGTAVYGIHKF